MGIDMQQRFVGLGLIAFGLAIIWLRNRLAGWAESTWLSSPISDRIASWLPPRYALAWLYAAMGLVIVGLGVALAFGVL